MNNEKTDAKWVENGVSDVVFRCSDKKPNIFLIGDSIRQGYCQTVKNELADEAEVFFFADNCRSTQYVIFCMKKWAGMFDEPARVDLVHFNCGQWDVAHFSGHALPLTSEEEYAKNLQIIIDLLRKFFPNARLVFATTTPMNPVGGSTGGVNPRTNEAVNTYNRIAAEIMEKNGIALDDLNAFARDFGSECYKDTCHYTEAAFATLGKEVARRILELL